MKFGQISSGASDDLEKLTSLAYAEVVQYGMNRKFGSLSYNNQNAMGYFGKPYSDETASMVDSEVFSIVTKFYHETLQLVQDNLESKYLATELMTDTRQIWRVLLNYCWRKKLYTTMTSKTSWESLLLN